MSVNYLENARGRRVTDVIMSFVWTTHLGVMYWRGTWTLLDLYVIPDDLYTGSWISYFGGILMSVIIHALYPQLNKWITPHQTVRIQDYTTAQGKHTGFRCHKHSNKKLIISARFSAMLHYMFLIRSLHELQSQQSQSMNVRTVV